MARSKKEECPPGAPLWLATYGDMMTLVLCFFVLLFSFSTLDTEKLRSFAESVTNPGQTSLINFKSSNGITGILGNGIIEFPTPAEPAVVKEEADEELIDKMEAYIEEKQRLLEEAYPSAYETYFETGMGTPQLTIQMQADQYEIKVGDNFFDSGSASLRAGFDVTALAAIVSEMYQPGSVIVIEGHTDNVPMNSPRTGFADNWDLGYGRAKAVFAALAGATGLDGSCFEVRSRGEYSPIAANDTAEGRQLNRRVMIYIKHQAFLGGETQ